MNTVARRIARLCAFATLALLAARAIALPPPEKLPASPTPPDPLVITDGPRITTAKDWHAKRAPGLRALFQNYEYGLRPREVAPVATIIREDKNALGGKATLREISVDTTLAANPVHLLVIVPNKQTRPAPCFLGMSFQPVYTLLADPLIKMPADGSEGKRGSRASRWPVEQIIDRGYALACFFNGDIMVDSPAPAKEALKRFAKAAGVNPDAPNAPGTIMAWAWGYSRMFDCLKDIPGIDTRRVAIVGHSRNGKAALLAAAFDERFALVIPNQAGCGGTAPSRVSADDAKPGPKGRPRVETVAAITSRFPHWFCQNFSTFAGAPEKLPFDQHALIALCAPRPVLISCATKDVWANPPGQLAMLRAADPVYQLVAKEGLRAGVTEMPATGKLIDSRLGFFIREGKHDMTHEDWRAWLDYADKWLR
ncbi:acetylxylan esterase [Ereboglobus luteus]|uniref:Acetylxylan esterase n=1 Tax=Ereboglobus luteus TaxID=1796921 RepID=A0A2U8E303_9BACT|nr:acetylxylan esterase [Ereboglobus luteus]AWI09259.1 acetylxylan esterase [Ereboglobus luteus]